MVIKTSVSEHSTEVYRRSLPWSNQMKSVVLSDIGAEPEGVGEGHVAGIRVVAGVAGLVRQLHATVAAIVV